MPDDQSLDGVEFEVVAPAPDSARISGRTRAGRRLIATDQGGKLASVLKNRLAEMLESAAQIEARRREASSVDVPDYQAAFRYIATREPRQVLRIVVFEALTLFGSALIAIAINIMTGSAEPFPIYLSLAGGLVIIAVSIYMKITG